MSLKINLSNHSDNFTVDSQEFSIEKKVNFIFGKNGTGKTTLADEINSQLSDRYDVCVFKDFEGVAENERLDAVALGIENSTIQGKINAIDKEITGIENQTKQPEDKKEDNLFTSAAKAQKKYDDATRAITSFFTSSAQYIKNLSNPPVAKTSYNKNDFESEILKASLLTDKDIASYKKTIKTDKKADVKQITFPNVDLLACLNLANEILLSSVIQPQDIPDLKDNVDKQSFARQGMLIHMHKDDEKCAFCGNRISDERWQLLGNYFNDEVKKLEGRIDSELENIKLGLSQIESITEITAVDFYDKFADIIKDLNLHIKVRRGEYKDFLERLNIALVNKRGNLFAKSFALEVETPINFIDIEQICNDLVKSHNELSKNLKTEQDNAKDLLRFHEVRKKLDEFKYDEENGKLSTLETARNEAKKSLIDKKQELQRKRDERKGLILQTKDEEKIAVKINRLLTNMGITSFSLKLVDGDSENQKGQYQIRGYNDKIRPVTQLSKGEKNIIAFLYFMFSLEGIGRENKPRLIVLDDPMTSNDDTMQYLMIGEIQKLYRNLKDGNYIIIFTHNCHFYLNVRPNTMPSYKKSQEKGLYEEVGFYDKYGIYHLFSDSKHTTIKRIMDGKQDFRTSYETLWKELVFLYNAKDATPDLMLSPCRKICETYLKFTKLDVMTFYGEGTNAKKLFDVNQHSIDDLEAEQNGITKEEIKNILAKLFDENGAKDHFTNHWKGGGK